MPPAPCLGDSPPGGIARRALELPTRPNGTRSPPLARAPPALCAPVDAARRLRARPGAVEPVLGEASLRASPLPTPAERDREAPSVQAVLHGPPRVAHVAGRRPRALLRGFAGAWPVPRRSLPRRAPETRFLEPSDRVAHSGDRTEQLRNGEEPQSSVTCPRPGCEATRRVRPSSARPRACTPPLPEPRSGPWSGPCSPRRATPRAVPHLGRRAAATGGLPG